MTSALPAASTTPERSTIEDRYKWDLGKMYASPEQWEEHYQQVSSLVTEFAARKGTTGQSASNLLAALQSRDQANIQLEKLYAYAAMKRDEDMRVPAAQALYQRAQTLAVKWDEGSSWFQPELLRIPEDRLRGWLGGAELRVYQHYFDDLLRTKAHILSAREEELLAMSGKATDASSESFGLLSNTELRWRTVKDAENRDIEITTSSFSQAMQSKDRRYRHDAFLALHNSFLDVKSTLAATLAGAMQRDWFYSKARGYPTCLHRALDAENLPLGVYDNLVRTVNDHVGLLHRYVALKKRVLKLDQVHFYDLYVNLVDVPERDYPYEKGRDLVLNGVKPFGPEYVGVMKQAFDSRWIDVYENKGKRSGAYNMGTYLSAPYVLLNYKGKFHDVSTVAHELGHATQSWFAAQNQPPIYAGYPMFTAEVASTAAEIVFKKSMLEQTKDRKERAFLINQMLEDMRGTLFRQTQFAEFDRAAHTLAEKGEPMTAEVLMKLCHDQYVRYYGPDFAIDPELDVECLRIPHYYRGYYVYRYADSYCAAAAIAKRILGNEPGARDQWMKFLKTGNSMYAIDMLKVAGVDMTSPKPIEDAMALFEQLLKELEQLLES
ncbi:MAG TPA: oligoendopeptidase F [Candidatus Paceibacterota bacterium]|nr:oligoendopeptidase F [Verrucomicrobiota bacterium]HSA09111.1 oligoendopeptidase F [Candidatus Paceibacterota bacterium]